MDEWEAIHSIPNCEKPPIRSFLKRRQTSVHLQSCTCAYGVPVLSLTEAQCLYILMETSDTISSQHQTPMGPCFDFDEMRSKLAVVSASYVCDYLQRKPARREERPFFGKGILRVVSPSMTVIEIIISDHAISERATCLEANPIQALPHSYPYFRAESSYV